MIIAKKYKILEHIGCGHFGSVFKGICLKPHKILAIKMERENTKHSLLKHEATVLHYLGTQKCINIPHLFYYGLEKPNMYVIMSFFPQGSLDIWRPVLSLEEKIMWWNTALDIIEHIHKAGIVHRDLKPQHFIRNENHEWHLIDFGLATSFLDESQEHIREIPRDHIIGSPNYVSWFVHEGKDVVRRDDFLSLIYLFWELMYGSYLQPYEKSNTGISAAVLDEYNIWLRDQKKFPRLYELLTRKNDNMVNFMISLISHAEELKFKDKPNYFLFQLSLRGIPNIQNHLVYTGL